jgi:hypothetical protein
VSRSASSARPVNAGLTVTQMVVSGHDGWPSLDLPQASLYLALINACVHLIREDERTAAG